MTLPLFARVAPRPECCAVCGRQAASSTAVRGVFVRRGAFWLCTDPYCHTAAEGLADMKAAEITPIEAAAIIEGGNAGGAYLDSLGKTDLAALTPDEYATFLHTALNAFGGSMRRQCAKIEVPF